MRFLCLALILVSLVTSGCSAFRRTSSAKELERHWATDVTEPSNNNAGFVGRVIYDSEQKCALFVAELTASESLSNTGLDMTTTALSALATAFTPLATVHALPAGASISSGWKTAIDTDVFAKASIANYAEAIQLSYYQNIHNLIQSLPSDPDERVNASVFLAEVQEIHQGCSLGSAQLTVSKTLQDASKVKQAETQQNAKQGTATSTRLVSVVGPFKKGDDLVVLATSSQLPIPVTQINYKVSNQTSPLYVANSIAEKIRSDSSMKSAKVAVTVRSSASSAVLELDSPIDTPIDWTFSPKDRFVTIPVPTGEQKKAQPTILPPGASLLS